MTPQSPNEKGIRVPRRLTKDEIAEQSLEITIPGRLPDEVLGEIRESQLMPGMIQATIGTIIVMLLWTGISAALAKPTKKMETAASVENAVPAAKPAAPAEGSSDPAKPAAATPEAPTTAKAGSTKNKELQPPGADEVKAVPADVNPLENSADDLLKDLK